MRNSFLYICIVFVLGFQSVFALQTEIPFGGEVTNIQICSCPYVATHLLTIKNFDGKIIKLSYIPLFSKIYLSYNYMGATYILGTYSPSKRFQCYSGSDCDPKRDDGALGSQPGTGFN